MPSGTPESVGLPEKIENFAREPNGSGFLAQYKELARLMYEVRRLCPRVSLLGASAVNPRHPLPADHLELLAALAKEGSKGSSHQLNLQPFSVLVRSWIWNFLSGLRDTLRLMRLKVRFASAMRKAKREPASVIMKTWSFGPESLKGSDDFYYGKLPTLLRERGVSCLLLCGDFHGGDEEVFARTALERTRIRSMPERVLIPLWAPLLTVFDQILASLALRRMARHSRDPRFSIVCARASVECLRPFTRQVALYFYIAKAAVECWRPRAFITLYEGQPWEKPAWHGAKAADRGCVVVGYQHTVIMAHSLALLSPNRDSWELSTPDVVLCLGETTRRMLKAGHEPHGTKLIPFGSFRRNPGDSVLHPPRPDRRTVLVAPEGTASEAELLFNFALRVAPLVPDHRFIFRCHPVLPFSVIRHLLQGVPEDFRNVEVSDRDSMADDFARSSVVLYRGSSVVVYAVMEGLKPVYLHDAGHYDRDPLFEVDGWRERVSLEEEFVEVLRCYLATGHERALKEWRPAAEYAKGYSESVSEGSMDHFLAAVGLGDKGAGR